MKRDDSGVPLDLPCAKARYRASLARGFTLIELIIVVAIIAILAAIALPSYHNHVMHGNRNAAEGVMLDMAAAQERFLIDNRAYTTSVTQLGYATLPDSTSSNYKIAVATSSGPPPSYTITATPVANGPQASDTVCNILTLANDGTKGVQSASGSVTQCWQ
ncbi:type IV pilin protein [Dyella silvae]|uniref:type IV pilin protein n=1 Tax=Dyella silvae TaxID=2994424 RepID=UPI002B27A18C|nr:type IV pilin protein [Dyella silvae]